jgi:tetratricopeptide (TPR) repeat protein
MQAPTKDVNPSYATHFLNYRGMVDTEYMTNYLESDTHTELIWDPILRLNFLHFSIAPKTVSVDYYEPNDQYFSNYTMDVSLRKDDEVFFQYSKNFPFYFPADDMNKIKANGLVIEDSFPVVDGTYELDVLLRNSVGKEFTLLEQVVKIEEVTDSPQIMGPFLGHDIKTYDGNVHIPYKVLNKKLVVDPRQIFSTSDSVSFLFILSNIERELWEGGKVEIYVKGSKQQSKPKSFTKSLNSNLFKNTLVMNHTLSALELPPDYYELGLRLVDKEKTVVDEKFNNFTVSFQETLSHPITRMKAFPRAHDYVFLFMVARQYSKTNNDEKAQVFYKRAVEMNPAYKKGLIEYAQFLLKTEQYAECLGLIEKVKDDEEFKFDYYLIKGRMYMGMEMYSRAIENFIEGNKIYNSNITLLNSLGYSYYKMGEREKALEALKASLKLNTEQKDIQELVKKLEEKIGR